MKQNEKFNKKGEITKKQTEILELTEDSVMQRKESVNLKTGILKLSSQRRKKKKERKRVKKTYGFLRHHK